MREQSVLFSSCHNEVAVRMPEAPLPGRQACGDRLRRDGKTITEPHLWWRVPIKRELWERLLERVCRCLAEPAGLARHHGNQTVLTLAGPTHGRNVYCAPSHPGRLVFVLRGEQVSGVGGWLEDSRWPASPLTLPYSTI